MVIDWTQPLELLDGTPVRLVEGYDAQKGDSYWLIEREDGKMLTSSQHPGWSGNPREDLLLEDNGAWWMDPSGPSFVRNRPAVVESIAKMVGEKGNG